MKKGAVVLGSSGFIGHHLVNYLKDRGYWVRGVDKRPQRFNEKTDEFYQWDLTDPSKALAASMGVSEVYQLAAEMGGMGFISSQHIASLHESSLINTYALEAAAKNKVERFFFSSSVCVYPINKQNTLKKYLMKEEDSYPAYPNEAYGWEKLVNEIRCKAYEEEYGLNVRIARFDNTYGPECRYKGGREKVPAALCRKVIEADKEIEVWGDGKQTRPFVYIDDLLEGIYRITQGDYSDPVNLGSDEVISINDLAQRIIDLSGKKLKIRNVDGPQGVRSRYIDHTLAKRLYRWEARTDLDSGLLLLLQYIKEAVQLG